MSDPIYDLKVRSLTQIKPLSTDKKDVEVNGDSFSSIIEQKIRENSQIEFSKHAIKRVIERDIELSTNQLERLNYGVQLATQKGLNEPLILVDRTAFVVNVLNNKVITTVNEDALTGNVFTNIDGAVIV
ncbi:MAG TPA: TIGR02530 family flagellar biosynthesis protein [Erysipelotrichaceae bacterium]|nr:TIGR02530 family flagellar biosynthesis protein [Erysipelotrichaceae bacterium]